MGHEADASEAEKQHRHVDGSATPLGYQSINPDHASLRSTGIAMIGNTHAHTRNRGQGGWSE
jgi:hypothetical protein